MSHWIAHQFTGGVAVLQGGIGGIGGTRAERSNANPVSLSTRRCGTSESSCDPTGLLPRAA